MIHDIYPKKIDITYFAQKPSEGDICFVFSGKDSLVKQEKKLNFLKYEDAMGSIIKSIYLFSIDNQKYFLADLCDGFLPTGFKFSKVKEHRRLSPKDAVFAEMTAFHLYTWYTENRYCGRCGALTCVDEALRMISCPDCHNMIFPKISPAIIVAVTDGENILLTKYKGRPYSDFALVAGFIEIGETPEQAAVREVEEEAGVKIKNLRYYKSQPWGVDSNLLLGYFAELDGSCEITIDETELSLAEWYPRSQIPLQPEDTSLTNEMVQVFKNKLF
ncbi:MAG: NAD(+) diphosphatase [Bacillota bacterium]|nr:NAD(+) diphosphatase [Bacillota bacterium]